MGAELKIKNEEGKTAYDYVTEDKTLAQILKPTGSLPNYLTREFWQSVTPEQLKETLKNVKNVNQARSDNQETMLILLIKYGQYPEMVNALIQAGANVLFKSCAPAIPCGTALHYISFRSDKSYEFAQALLPYYKNIDELDDNGANPLQWIIFAKIPLKTVLLFLEKGANPNLQTKNGNHALISAVVPNPMLKEPFIDPQVVQALLDFGADLKIKNNEGKSAYDYMKQDSAFSKTELFKQISAKLQ